MTPIAPHITAFLRERLPMEKRASSHTTDSYAYAFQLLFTFVSKRLGVTPSSLNLEQIDAPTIVAFLEHLEADRGNGPSSRNVRLAAIKSFMRYVEYRVSSALEQVRRILAIPTKKTDSRLVAHLTVAEMEAVLDAPDPATAEGIRDRAMLHVGFAAGLRVSELVGLQLVDVSFQPTPSILVRGKGRRERLLPIWKETATAIRAWLRVRWPALGPELFLNARGQNITRSGFEYVLKKHVTSAGASCPSLLKRQVSPHVLRHTCAMNTLRATGDIRKVSLWLGHSCMQTTEVYVRNDPTEKLDVLAAVRVPTLRKGRFRPPDKLIASLKAPR